MALIYLLMQCAMYKAGVRLWCRITCLIKAFTPQFSHQLAYHGNNLFFFVRESQVAMPFGNFFSPCWFLIQHCGGSSYCRDTVSQCMLQVFLSNVSQSLTLSIMYCMHNRYLTKNRMLCG